MNELLFNEEKHEYTLNGEVLISVTQLLEKHGLAPKYDGVDAELLKKRAEYGKMIHKEIELYLKNGTIGFSKECQNFIKWFEGQNRYEFRGSELMVYYKDIYAGTLDILLCDTKSQCWVIVDLKTTSIIHEESVSWQESLYAFAHYSNFPNLENYKGMVIHLKDDVFEVKEISLKATEDIKALIDCEINGTIFSYQVANIKKALVEVEKLELAIISQEETLKALKTEQDEFKAKIREEMESRNIKSLDTPRLRITIKNNSVRKSIDTDRLFKEHPEINKNDYLKEALVKGGLVITIKENEEE